MKKHSLWIYIMILIFLSPSSAFAVVVFDMAAEANTLHTYQQLLEEFKRLGEIKALNQKSLQQLIQQHQAMVGNYGMGDIGYDAHLSTWGSDTEQWKNVLNLYQQGGNPGDLSKISKQLNQQFPIQLNSVANPNSHSLDAKYYDLKAKTALANRAASQLAYDNTKKQMDCIQQLHQQIDKTPNMKAALDLQNRLLFESNRTQLELLRLISLNNQQQAVKAQGEVNSIVNNFNAAN